MVGVTNHGRRRWAAAALLGMGAIGYAFGAWNGHGSEVAAQPPAGGGVIPASATQSDYSQRVIAYIHGNIPVTREDLGEYLIDRYGQKKINSLVNRKIIDHACKQLNVTVTPEEVEAAINDEMGTMNLDRATFIKQYLKQYNMTLFEWKEDVTKPRLLLAKLSAREIRVEDADIQKAYDARYGEKVKCRFILWPKLQERFAYQVYDKIRTSEAEFDKVARSQASTVLSAHGGFIDPIGHGAGDDTVEKIAFKLRTGEVSELFTIPEQGIAVLRCEGRLPPDETKTFAGEKEQLRKVVFDMKLAKMIPIVFNKLKEEAKPIFVLKHGTTDADVLRAAEEELKLSNQPGTAPVPLPLMK